MSHALLVDDHEDTLAALAEFVRREGFTVSVAPTIESARAELGRHTPDVILADLNLPDGSGMPLASISICSSRRFKFAPLPSTAADIGHLKDEL